MKKLTPAKAAAKAFRDCRSDSKDSQKIVAFVAKQHFIASGASQSEAAAAMLEINSQLEQMFAKNDQKPETPRVRRLTSLTVQPTMQEPS